MIYILIQIFDQVDPRIICVSLNFAYISEKCSSDIISFKFLKLC